MRHSTTRTRRALLTGFALAALAGIGITVQAADHADSPDTDQGNLDINDIYAFSQGDDIVFIMTVAPLLTPGEATENARLNPRGLYQFNLDAQRDGIAEAVIQVATAGVGSSQVVTYRGPVSPETTGTTARIVPGSFLQAKFDEVASGGGMTAWAGPSDDPFYINLFGDRSLTSVLNGVFEAALGTEVGEPDQIEFADPGADDLAGLNTLSIVVQLPKSQVADALGIAPDGTFFVWGTTSVR